MDLEKHSLPFLESLGVRNEGLSWQVGDTFSLSLPQVHLGVWLKRQLAELHSWEFDSVKSWLGTLESEFLQGWLVILMQTFRPWSEKQYLSPSATSPENNAHLIFQPAFPPTPPVTCEFCMWVCAHRPAFLLCSKHTLRIPNMEPQMWVPSKLQTWLLECLVLLWTL